MDFRSRIDPAEAARHREVMEDMGVYDVQWAVAKVLELSDVRPGQNRLLLTKDTVRAGSIPKVFPELEELREDGLNAEIKITVPVLGAEGKENKVYFRYLNSNKAYRLTGAEWKLFVDASGMSMGDRIDLYTCRRGHGERCLFAFRTEEYCNASGWSSKARKRARQPAADAVRDLYTEDDEEFFPVNGGRAGGANGKHRVDVDCTRAKRDRRGAKNNASHVGRDDHTLFLSIDDDAHAWNGGSEGEYGCCKNEKGREDRLGVILIPPPTK